MQYNSLFLGSRNGIFFNCDAFLMNAPKMDFVCLLEPSRLCVSDECPESIFIYSYKLHFSLYIVGCMDGCSWHRLVNVM